MIEKHKVIYIAVICFFAFAYGCLLTIFICSLSVDRTGVTDSQRVEHYEDRSESAQNAVTELEDGLNDVAEQMHSVGREIESGITDVGELSAVGDRIAGASTDIAESAGRIEKGIQRIEQILSEAEEKNGVLADCIGSPGNGGSD